MATPGAKANVSSHLESKSLQSTVTGKGFTNMTDEQPTNHQSITSQWSEICFTLHAFKKKNRVQPPSAFTGKPLRSTEKISCLLPSTTKLACQRLAGMLLTTMLGTWPHMATYGPMAGVCVLGAEVHPTDVQESSMSLMCWPVQR